MCVSLLFINVAYCIFKHLMFIWRNTISLRMISQQRFEPMVSKIQNRTNNYCPTHSVNSPNSAFKNNIQIFKRLSLLLPSLIIT